MCLQNTSQTPFCLSLHSLNQLWQIESVSRAGGGADYFVVQPKDDGLAHTGTKRLPIRMKIPEELKQKGRTRCEVILKVFVTTRVTSFAALRSGRRLPGQNVEGTVRGQSTQLSSCLASLATPCRGTADDARDLENEWASRNFNVRTIDEDFVPVEQHH